MYRQSVSRSFHWTWFIVYWWPELTCTGDEYTHISRLKEDDVTTAEIVRLCEASLVVLPRKTGDTPSLEMRK